MQIARSTISAGSGNSSLSAQCHDRLSAEGTLNSAPKYWSAFGSDPTSLGAVRRACGPSRGDLIAALHASFVTARMHCSCFSSTCPVFDIARPELEKAMHHFWCIKTLARIDIPSTIKASSQVVVTGPSSASMVAVVANTGKSTHSSTRVHHRTWSCCRISQVAKRVEVRRPLLALGAVSRLCNSSFLGPIRARGFCLW